VDSGLAPIGNQSALFAWNLLPPTGAPVTFTTRGTPANDTATVDAQSDGFARLVVTDISSGNLGADTLPILVHQVGYYILITPDSASVLIGNSATFQATVVDFGNEPLAGDTVHWRFDPNQPGKLTIVDTSVFNQVTVRMDSTPIGSTFLTAFWARPRADTAFGYSPFDTLQSFATVFNPVQTPIAVGGNPYQVAVNPVTNRVYVSNVGASEVAVLDGANNAILALVNAGGPTTVTVVNPKANRVYVSRITTLGSRILALSGGNTVVDTSGGGGFRPTGMAVDTARNRVYVAANSCFFDPQQVTLVCSPIGEVQLFALNGDSLGEVLAIADSTPGQGRGMAYNPATGRIYVAVSNGSVDTVRVIDAATLTAIDSIEVGSGAFGVAVNPVTNRIYVTNETDGTMSVIDGATNAVVATVSLGFNTFPEGLGVDPNTNRIYVSEAGVGVMRVIDGVTNTEIGQIFVGGISTDAQPNPVTGRFYVPLYQDGVVKSFRFQ
jgi:YVTN family beta-propeller protein